jgi:hypothetical protein
MTYNICNECETVAHCLNHGCIPKVTLEPIEVKRVTHKDILRSAARSSGLDVYGLGLDRDMWEAALARYTEIIVRECIDELDGKIYRASDHEGDETWPDLILKEHFGIEE